MRILARASAVFAAVGVFAVAFALPGAGAPPSKIQDVRVVNGSEEPVPVAGTVNVGNTPTVNVGNTPTVNVGGHVTVVRMPFQDLVGASGNPNAEGCSDIEVPQGTLVMLQNISVEAEAPEGRPDVLLRTGFGEQGVTNFDRFTGELTHRGFTQWGGFWDVDMVLGRHGPGTRATSGEICAVGEGTRVSAMVTGYFEQPVTA